MSQSRFQKAVRKARKLRMSFQGPAGSGKTYSALAIATRIGKRVAVIDTEHSSASLYADRFDFCSLALERFAPDDYIGALEDAAAEGFDVVIIDSLSHAWIGEGGLLDQADKRGGKFDAWKHLTPQQNAMVKALLTYPGHVIVTMRTKTSYDVSKDEKTGKQKVEKTGTAPVQKEGTEYEFDIVIDIDSDNLGHVTKTRCEALTGQVYPKPGAQLAGIIKAWLETGEPEAKPVTGAKHPNRIAAEKLIRDLWAEAQKGAAELGALERLTADADTIGMAYVLSPEDAPDTAIRPTRERLQAIVADIRAALGNGEAA